MKDSGRFLVKIPRGLGLIRHREELGQFSRLFKFLLALLADKNSPVIESISETRPSGTNALRVPLTPDI